MASRPPAEGGGSSSPGSPVDVADLERRIAELRLATNSDAKFSGILDNLEASLVAARQVERQSSFSSSCVELGLLPQARRWAGQWATNLRSGGVRACGADLFQGLRRRVVGLARAARLRTSTSLHGGLLKADAALEDCIVMVERGLQVAVRVTLQAATSTRAKASSVSTKTRQLVSQKSFQTTAASSVTGALALGAGGGAAGLAAGSVVGGMAGMPLAVFTLGLSIPFGAAIGGGLGLLGGIAAGATTGAVSGGAVGYGVYTNKDQISGAARRVAAKSRDGSDRLSGAAKNVVNYVKDAFSVTRGRAVSAGTGGTERS